MRIGFFFDGCVGRYEFVGQIGEGGFGRVVRVRGASGRQLAVKYLHDMLDADAARRFTREMQILRQVRHPNVIELVDNGVTPDGQHWYAMPEMQGGRLADVIARKRTWEEVLTLMIGVADGLAAYHRLGGIHRDIKPENILIDEFGVPKLTDFGLARCPTITGSAMTRTPCGTEAYMAPEVWTGETCQASDIYALGVVFCELVNGERHLVPAKPPRLAKVGPDLQPMQELYERMTHADPRRRPSAAEVAAASRGALAWITRPAPPATKSSGPTALEVVGVVGGVVLGAIAIGALVDALTSDRA